MTQYKVDTLTGRPERKTRNGSKASAYPFDLMTPGTGFYVPAEHEASHHHCRVATSNYNKKFGTNIRCNKTNDGRLQVWMPKQDQNEPVQHPTEEQHPTKFEFVAWIGTMQNGTAVYIPKEYASRFNEFTTWIEELNNQLKMSCSAVVDGERLKITKGGRYENTTKNDGSNTCR